MQEIARSAQQAAQGTEAVSANLGAVAEATGRTQEIAASSRAAADDLARQCEGVAAAVQSFLTRARAAA